VSEFCAGKWLASLWFPAGCALRMLCEALVRGGDQQHLPPGLGRGHVLRLCACFLGAVEPVFRRMRGRRHKCPPALSALDHNLRKERSVPKEAREKNQRATERSGAPTPSVVPPWPLGPLGLADAVTMLSAKH
jgi:hypothetical protein